MAEILDLTNMIEKVSKEKHDELVKKIESIKKAISEKLRMFTDWKEVLAANKELVVEKGDRESIERMEEYLNNMLDRVYSIDLDEIDEEEELIDKVVEGLEIVGIGINDEIQEKVIDESIQKVKSSDTDNESKEKFETDSEKEKEFTDEDIFSYRYKKRNNWELGEKDL